MTAKVAPTLAPRRTQEERRAQTIEKLLDATAATLAEIGYARTTVQEICTRAGVSQGGLFRHFASIDELMAATGEHVGKKLLASYRKKFSPHASGSAALVSMHDRKSLEHAIRVLRDHARSKDNCAWYELFNAARTNKALKRALTPVVERYSEDIAMLAHEIMPEVAAATGPYFFLLIDMLVSAFDGEALHAGVMETPIPVEERIAILASFGEFLAQKNRG